MADINQIQQEWQQTLDTVEKANAATNGNIENIDKQLSPLADKLAKAHGLSKLRNHFTRKKMKPLQEKKDGLLREISERNSDACGKAAAFYREIRQDLLNAAPQASRLNELQQTLSQFNAAQSALNSDRYSCDNSETTTRDEWTTYQMYGVKPVIMMPVKHYGPTITHYHDDDVKRYYDSARESLEKLQQQQPQSKIPQLSDDLSGSGSQYRDEAARRINAAASALQDVSRPVSSEESSLRTTALAQARKANPVADALMSKLEQYLGSINKISLPNSPLRTAAYGY